MDRPPGPRMSGIARPLKRAAARRTGAAPTTNPPLFRAHPDGLGYDALRPTKGWLRVSAKRLRARAMLTYLRHRLLTRRSDNA
jgi:hypothetical protein